MRRNGSSFLDIDPQQTFNMPMRPGLENFDSNVVNVSVPDLETNKHIEIDQMITQNGENLA